MQQPKKEKTLMERISIDLCSGGTAGAIARSVVSPFDRVKILMQTQHILHKGEPQYTGVVQSLKKICREEGVAKLWRGNGTNVLRVVPYTATQFTTYDAYKRWRLQGTDRIQMDIADRLLAGALAAGAAVTATHPLDVIRLRLATQPELKGTVDSTKALWHEGGLKAMYKGYIPTLVSLGPFQAVNFSAFDTLKSWVYPDPKTDKNPLIVLGLGSCAGLFAQTVCFPLDTVRRRMQLKGKIYNGTIHAFRTIIKDEGFLALYRGMTPNAIKVVPNNGIRFMVYEAIKTYFMS